VRKFGEIGEVVRAKIAVNPESGKPKGFGFVDFANPQDAEKALRKLQGAELCGRPIRIAMPSAISSPEMPGKDAKSSSSTKGPPPSGHRKKYDDSSESRSRSRRRKRRHRSRSGKRAKSKSVEAVRSKSVASVSS